MTQQFELAVIVSLVVWYTIWAGMRRPGNGRAKNGESWQNGQEGESTEAVFEMQGGIHYFGRGVPLLSLLEAVIHEGPPPLTSMRITGIIQPPLW